MSTVKEMRVQVNVGDREDPPSNLQEFLDWVNWCVAQIPTEYRDAAEFDFDAHIEWNSAYVDVDVFYWRPFTPEERDEIAAKQKAVVAQSEKEEREAYERLAKKYGGKP